MSAIALRKRETVSTTMSSKYVLIAFVFAFAVLPFLGERNHHITFFMGEMNATMEIGVVSKRRDPIGESSQWTIRSCHTST